MNTLKEQQINGLNGKVFIDDIPINNVDFIFEMRRKAKVAIVKKGKNFFHLIQHNKVVGFASSYAYAVKKANELERGVHHD